MLYDKCVMQTLNGGGVLGPLCYKLITIVNYYVEMVYPVLFTGPKASHIIIVIEIQPL